jgi:hypothetical protein
MTKEAAMRWTMALGLAIAAAWPLSAQPGWSGTYVFDADLGRDAVGRGNAIGVEHRLIIGGRDGCRLMATGFQSDEDIRCTARAGRDGLRVAFKSHGDGSVRNRYGVAQYRPGAVLFTLSRAGRGIVTTWGSYRPDGAVKPSGAYFRRAQ